MLITQEHEDQLWRQGIMGNHSLSALLNAVFFYNEKYFHLRGVQEHEQLKFGQSLQYKPRSLYLLQTWFEKP